MTCFSDLLHDISLFGGGLSHHKKSGQRSVATQDLKKPRCKFAVWPVVECQSHPWLVDLETGNSSGDRDARSPERSHQSAIPVIHGLSSN
jgi:hypothetical protein